MSPAPLDTSSVTSVWLYEFAEGRPDIYPPSGFSYDDTLISCWLGQFKPSLGLSFFLRGQPMSMTFMN